MQNNDRSYDTTEKNILLKNVQKDRIQFIVNIVTIYWNIDLLVRLTLESPYGVFL